MRTGRVPLQAFKVALAVLCVSWIEEKYRCTMEGVGFCAAFPQLKLPASRHLRHL